MTIVVGMKFDQSSTFAASKTLISASPLSKSVIQVIKKKIINKAQ